MQRSAQLAVLSREHHIALEIALRLQRATDDNRRAVIAATLDFWNDEGLQHFELEEELLLPALAAHTSADDPDIQRILGEHADLRERITGLSGSTDPENQPAPRTGRTAPRPCPLRGTKPIRTDRNHPLRTRTRRSQR